MKKFLPLLVFHFSFFTFYSCNAQTTPFPEWVFYHWVWEDESTQHSALQLVDDYLAHDIPVGAIIIDSPWETGYNTFEWDSTLYPDAQAMIDSFHARGVRVLTWTTTAINTDVTDLWNYGDSLGYFMKSSSGSGSAVINWWKGDGSMIDFFNPDAVAWWKSLMDKTLGMGIDGWKCDGTDYSVLLGNALYSSGAGRSVSRLEYSHAYYNLFFNYTRQQLGNDRLIMSRPVDNYGYTFITDPNLVSFTPRAIGFACWVGDQDATFNGLKNALNNMYHSDANNYLIFGSDIGGYREESVTHGRNKDLFIRWAQLGAFSPLMENGGGGEHRPWIFDSQTSDIYKKFTRLHYALIPYLMQQGDSLFTATQSLMQFFNSSNYRYILGSDIFVAPVLSSSNSVAVTFPSGSWTYLFNNSQVYQGGATTTLNVPLDEYPVFIKSNSPLLAILDSVLGNVTSVKEIAQQNHVNIYPNPNSTSSWQLTVDESFVGSDFIWTDIHGRNVYQSEITNQKSEMIIADIPNGIYFYTITKPNYGERVSGKLVVQK